MIVDLDDATTEPSRRSHLAALSAVVAAISLVLLIALIRPAPRDTPPLAAAPAASPTPGTAVSFASEAAWIRGGPFEEELRDDVMGAMCAAGLGSNSQVHHLVFDREGRPIAAYTSGTTGRFIALPRVYVGSGWLTVPCDASDVFAPRINRAR